MKDLLREEKAPLRRKPRLILFGFLQDSAVLATESVNRKCKLLVTWRDDASRLNGGETPSPDAVCQPGFVGAAAAPWDVRKQLGVCEDHRKWHPGCCRTVGHVPVGTAALPQQWGLSYFISKQFVW
jgi:hypothetical protein